MKLKHLIFLFIIVFIPNVKSDSLSKENNSFTLKEKVFTNSKDINCVKALSDYFICNKADRSGVNYKIKKNDDIVLAEYSVNCLEGFVKGTVTNNNDKNINEIISDSIKKTCKNISENKVLLSSIYNLPDSTNKNSELICNPNDLSFSNAKFEVCKVHDNQDNFLVRINDFSKDIIFAQVTGNCSNPNLQDSYFNQQDINRKKITLIKEKVLPRVKDKICSLEVNNKLPRESINFFNINDPYSEAYLKMAMARYAVGDIKIAFKEVNRSISINPFNSFAYNARGEFLNAMGNINSSLSDFNKAIELNPEVIKFYINRVNLLVKKELYNEALLDYNKIITLQPNSNIWVLKRGLLKIKLSKFNEALTDISKYLKFDKNNSLAYRNRGIIYLNLGDFNKACADLSISKNLNDLKTKELLEFINFKNSNICNSFNIRTSNNLNNNIEDINFKEYKTKEECNKKTFVKFDENESCFN